MKLRGTAQVLSYFQTPVYTMEGMSSLCFFKAVPSRVAMEKTRLISGDLALKPMNMLRREQELLYLADQGKHVIRKTVFWFEESKD